MAEKPASPPHLMWASLASWPHNAATSTTPSSQGDSTHTHTYTHRHTLAFHYLHSRTHANAHTCTQTHPNTCTHTHMHPYKPSRHLGNGLWVFILSSNCNNGRLLMCSRTMCSCTNRKQNGLIALVMLLRILPTISSSGRAVKLSSAWNKQCQDRWESNPSWKAVIATVNRYKASSVHMSVLREKWGFDVPHILRVYVLYTMYTTSYRPYSPKGAKSIFCSPKDMYLIWQTSW